MTMESNEIDLAAAIGFDPLMEEAAGWQVLFAGVGD